MNHSQQEYLHYSEASILYEWSENLSPKTSKCSLWRTSLSNALGITLGICCILSKLNGHTVLPNAPVTCTLEGNFGPQPLKLLEFSSFLSLVYLSSLLLIVINVSEKNFFPPLSLLIPFVCTSCLLFSVLSVCPFSPSLSFLSSMLYAWKVPGLSVRCFIFCRALVTGIVPQKVSCFQLILQRYTLPLLIVPFFAFLCLYLS